MQVEGDDKMGYGPNVYMDEQKRSTAGVCGQRRKALASWQLKRWLAKGAGAPCLGVTAARGGSRGAPEPSADPPGRTWAGRGR